MNESIVRSFVEMELIHALTLTREEPGLRITVIAKVISSIFDEHEVNALIKDLNAQKTDRKTKRTAKTGAK